MTMAGSKIMQQIRETTGVEVATFLTMPARHERQRIVIGACVCWCVRVIFTIFGNC